MSLYGEGDSKRVVPDNAAKAAESYRSPWRRDFARLIHSPSFRRLQGKTQVFPGHESDFYRNRLTHSLEVAQIAKSIAIRLNATEPLFEKDKLEPDIVEFAGLAHDLGHPPFGHNGEEALDECMRNHGGFEGNAQSLRIVSRLEKKTTAYQVDGTIRPFDVNNEDVRRGLNLTYRSLAAILKYDNIIPERAADREKPREVVKGYYAEEDYLVRKIKENVIGANFSDKIKTIECSIMDIADDIAYSTYDLEDNLKAGFLTPMGLFALDDDIYVGVAKTIKDRAAKQYPEFDNGVIDADLVRQTLYFVFKEMLFGVDDELKATVRSRDLGWGVKKMMVAAEVQDLSRNLARDGYQRVQFTSQLVQVFLSNLEIVPHQKHPQLHNVRLTLPAFLHVEVLKNVTFHAIIKSPGLQVVEYRGKDIIKSIFKSLNQANGARLLPDDFQAICRDAPEMRRMRAICDFIAGMTDRYALEFYGRLFGTNQLTIHKPL
ncbi:MAG: dNTP triphosphohydrolase [Mesorhizobium sp.]|nr:MAG: dNTP triphosphohydrolase [Mesorhizobium sp.]